MIIVWFSERFIVHVMMPSFYIVDNGDDGRASTLLSKEAKCTMLFAVNVTDNKRAVYGMNFDKAGIKKVVFPYGMYLTKYFSSMLN